ncbi:hypothetical protein FK220_011670 [Flavobacteriaceae bacterium TP-CH-4]|uniref:Uncharacterized protein n=1 Tax=Pelagihabitans pacificus TaxID=2696054 RepID=A0A967E792_9FLAO|nr:hypothetical protein [Pelagihabitans pacificus]NHF60004.1 hypothetical protein [Pelagihabitans pacificus]
MGTSVENQKSIAPAFGFTGIAFFYTLYLNTKKMRTLLSLLMVLGCMVLGTSDGIAQTSQEQPEKPVGMPQGEEDEGPAIFRFEPDYLLSVEAKRERLRRTRKILDTMDISERKRRKLLKDLHKNGWTERLQKILVVDTKFEEDIEE